ncbi:hypothetical protein Phum_PHUM511910 [Pediculus humanus corporis]|uniref:Uncharacterized protein n=1 Tax=Pediculus humanus subsp. corporis TaxID=121224 RepID=E0VY92_PEDHC|nr:uncharacterized protein Phum_PHUM511910 [Pediculus humanus corporis]EEB18348.1 hypothetical protein Phum_PHUM511910 [Pediculus humanus corporis]
MPVLVGIYPFGCFRDPPFTLCYPRAKKKRKKNFLALMNSSCPDHFLLFFLYA